MEFNFNIEKVIPSRFTVVEFNNSNSVLNVYSVVPNGNNNEECNENWTCNLSFNIISDGDLRKKKENLEFLIDQMGYASAQAQELLSPITSLKKLINSSQQKLYIFRDVESPFSVIGLLKIGLKRLFICDDAGAHHEIDTYCVLDFYVHESKQRCGFGHELFNVMLEVEKLEPYKLAIDRPSCKFLCFLRKHYNLSDPKPQANNFVVYSGFFDRNDFQISKENSSERNSYQNRCSERNSMNALETVPISMSVDLKNRSSCSSSGNCYSRDDSKTCINEYFKKKRPSSISSYNASPFSGKREKNWGVYDALHTYSGNDTNSDDWRKAQCTLTPVGNENTSRQQKLNQRRSSWNVLGVEPIDYSMLHEKS